MATAIHGHCAIVYINMVCHNHTFNRIDDEANALTGCFARSLGLNLFDSLQQKIVDFDATPTRVPQDVHRRFLAACMIVLQDGVHCAARDDTPPDSGLHHIFICKRGLYLPSDLSFGVHRMDNSEFRLPSSKHNALQPMADFVRAEFEQLGVRPNLGTGVVLVDVRHTISESADFIAHGPGRGGTCKYLQAARIVRRFSRPQEAKVYALLCFAEALRRRERRVASILQEAQVAHGSDDDVWKFVMKHRAQRAAAIPQSNDGEIYIAL